MADFALLSSKVYVKKIALIVIVGVTLPWVLAHHKHTIFLYLRQTALQHLRMAEGRFDFVPCGFKHRSYILNDRAFSGDANWEVHHAMIRLRAAIGPKCVVYGLTGKQRKGLKPAAPQSAERLGTTGEKPGAH